MNQEANDRENKAKNCFLENISKIENSLVKTDQAKKNADYQC